MELTPEDKEKVKKWIEQKAGFNLRCFVCGNQQWGIDRFAAMTVSIDVHTGRVDYMNGYPLIGLICGHCAHTVWFNANLIGLKP